MNPDLKRALWSIFIGACVAFFSTFLDGLVDLLKHPGDDLIGGAVSSILFYARKWN